MEIGQENPKLVKIGEETSSMLRENISMGTILTAV
jgi:hypothetical protein